MKRDKLLNGFIFLCLISVFLLSIYIIFLAIETLVDRFGVWGPVGILAIGVFFGGYYIDWDEKDG